MKKIAVLMLLLSCSFSCMAQDILGDFLKNPKFVNGTDTIIVNATLLDLTQMPPPLISMEAFYKEKKLSGQLIFRPANCTQEYNAPLSNVKNPDGLLNGENLGISVSVTCVVFKKYLHAYGGDMPFFIVTNVVPLKPIGCKIQGNNEETCNFLRNLHFKNGIDTITFEAEYVTIFKQNTSLILKELDRKKMLKVQDLNYGIGFKVANCPNHFIASYHFKDTSSFNLLEKQPEGQKINLTCIVFEGYYSYNQPYFIIDKVQIKNPD